MTIAKTKAEKCQMLAENPIEDLEWRNLSGSGKWISYFAGVPTILALVADHTELRVKPKPTVETCYMAYGGGVPPGVIKNPFADERKGQFRLTITDPNDGTAPTLDWDWIPREGE